ncbi:hypothetical protein NVS89_13400 [Ancylobacter sp. MQZ15Z-1]|uniref:Uncharacterized protein n=1 Tax=Ancylobacter mangrovi TaxID=2972472 RepID=A0A9X2PHC8_9HYPH|nr:hypothetical protein [Ancylobacter mangrovi]MCS0496095.1 hypothetical protein [Ancylobacter mangrovi]
MRSKALRRAALAAGVGALVAMTSVSIVTPVKAQPATMQAIANTTAPAGAGADWAQSQVAALVQAAVSSGATGAQLADAIASLLANNPSLAQEITGAIIDASKGGVPGVAANSSLTASLATGVAIQVAVWQQTSGTSPVSQAALESVNQAFASADVSRGSDFATNFNSALSNEGGALAPTVLTSEDAVVEVVTTFIQKDETGNISPNT